MAEFDDLADRHRREAYGLRRSILDGVDVGEVTSWVIDMTEMIEMDVRAAYERWERKLGPRGMRDHLRSVGLYAFDRRWSEHLAHQDELYGQIPRDEARIGKEAVAELCGKMVAGFDETMKRIKEDMVRDLFGKSSTQEPNPS